MKVSIDIDCTPEEARAFLGLPQVAPMQEAVMEKLQQQILQNLAAMDPESLLKTVMPAGLEGWEQMQKMFWSKVGGAAGGGDEKR